MQPDGKIIVGGNFGAFNDVPQGNITRLNSDFSIDIAFNTNGIGFDTLLVPPAVRDIEIALAGKIVVAGNFTIFNGVARKKVARLNPDGRLDASFNFNTEDARSIYDVLPLSNGKILVVGTYNSTGVTTTFPLPRLVLRLNEDGSPDTSLDVNIGRAGTVNEVLVQSNGKILIGGEFEYVRGALRVNIARLNADGSLDTTFTSDNSGYTSGNKTNALALQLGGKILIGGWFTTVNNAARNHFARLNPGGSLNAAFNTGNGADNNVCDIEVQAEGKRQTRSQCFRSVVSF